MEPADEQLKYLRDEYLSYQKPNGPWAPTPKFEYAPGKRDYDP